MSCFWYYSTSIFLSQIKGLTTDSWFCVKSIGLWQQRRTKYLLHNWKKNMVWHAKTDFPSSLKLLISRLKAIVKLMIRAESGSLRKSRFSSSFLHGCKFIHIIVTTEGYFPCTTLHGRPLPPRLRTCLVYAPLHNLLTKVSRSLHYFGELA